MIGDLELYLAVFWGSLAFLGLGFVGAIAAMVLADESTAANRARQLSRTSAVLALVLLAVSAAVRLVTSYRPGTLEGMSVSGFLSDHPLFVLVALAAGLILWWVHRMEAAEKR